MGWAERKNQERQKRTVKMLFPSIEMQKEFDLFMKRTEKALRAFKKYSDVIVEIDEENLSDEELANALTPIFVELSEQMVSIYHTPQWIDADIKTLQNTISKIVNIDINQN